MLDLHDLPDVTVRRLTDYVTAVAYLTNGKFDHRVAPIVAEAWAADGFCVIKTSDIARRFSTSRQTAFTTIKRLVKARATREIGRTPEGHAKYVPCLERGDQWRQELDERLHG